MIFNSSEEEISLPAPESEMKHPEVKHDSVCKLRKLYGEHVKQKQGVFSPNKTDHLKSLLKL